MYRAFGPIVFRRCLRLLKDHDAAMDATQEVFLKLVVNAERLQEREEVLPWILRVATNHCLNVRRAARHVAVVTRTLEQERPESGADVLRGVLARRLLDRFDPATQRAVLGVIGAGYRQEDAAAALGLSTATVARKIRRFLDKARAHVAKSSFVEARGPASQAAGSRGRPAAAGATSRGCRIVASAPPERAPAQAAPARGEGRPLPRRDSLDPAA
jgi:RNA polymerase sigma-70 factor, ECF subfamily